MSDREWVKNQLLQQAAAIGGKRPYHGPTVALVMTAALMAIRELEAELAAIMEPPPDAVPPDEFDDPHQRRMREAFDAGRAYQSELEWRRDIHKE